MEENKESKEEKQMLDAEHNDPAHPDMDDYYAEVMARIPGHPLAHDCPIDECDVCAVRDCPHGAIEHYWHDGCPACWKEGR